MGIDTLAKLFYLAAAVLFILGLKNMAHPRTAVRGNLLGSAGMLLAVLVALAETYWLAGGAPRYRLLLLGGLVGVPLGTVLALRTPIAAMPQLVALFNGFGGFASVCVAGGELAQTGRHPWFVLLAVGLSGLIGSVTFWGSLMAFGKLQELEWFKQPFRVERQQLINGVLAALVVVSLLLLAAGAAPAGVAYLFIVVAAAALGVLLVNPIGGADMPVVIALLNSYSGLAAASTGFVIDNNILIIAGSLVGASGLILTRLMCRAMNRSLVNVLFGVMGGGAGAAADDVYATVRSTTAEDVALILDGARRVVFVPGYGMAVAQAQHAVRDVGRTLEERGVQVEYAIHPVAGRMPGHMNVLLAEADIDYEKLREMDDINPTMDTVDVAIVIGANDTVNPVAKSDPQSPIAGMPIVEVERARTVVVIKRSLSPGFAGIPNPLFAAPNALMLFADGQRALLDILAALKRS